jgi:hypothetical protein
MKINRTISAAGWGRKIASRRFCVHCGMTDTAAALAGSADAGPPPSGPGMLAAGL